MTIRHCRSCGHQTRHRHVHDLTEDRWRQTHVAGTERFECTRCGHAVFAHTEAAERFPFLFDGIRPVGFRPPFAVLQ
jgi:polyferredoxin